VVPVTAGEAVAGSAGGTAPPAGRQAGGSGVKWQVASQAAGSSSAVCSRPRPGAAGRWQTGTQT